MLAQYKKNITSLYKPLSKDEQIDLYWRMKNGDSSARDTLIYSCLPLVFKQAQKFSYNNRHVDIEDMIQAGNIALLHAVNDWDVNKSLITTTVVTYVHNALIDLIKDSRYSIRMKYDVSRKAAEDISKIKNVASNDIEEIALSTKLSKKRIQLLLKTIIGQRVGIDKGMNQCYNQGREEDVDESLCCCLADLLSLCDRLPEYERSLFLTWLKYVAKNNRAELAAQELSCSKEEVIMTVSKVKKKLKDIYHAEILRERR